MHSSQKVYFRLNQPVQVALGVQDGVWKEGRFGHYWTYLLEDDKIMFVPPTVQEQIQQLGITPGQRFTITKTQERLNGLRILRWMVALPNIDQLSSSDPSELAHQPAESVPTAQQPELAAPIVSEPEVKAQSNGSGSPNGSAGVNGSGKPADNGTRTELNCSPLLKAALRAAVDAVIDAEQYAASRSYNVRFTSEDVRAAGISIFIAARDGGRR